LPLNALVALSAMAFLHKTCMTIYNNINNGSSALISGKFSMLSGSDKMKNRNFNRRRRYGKGSALSEAGPAFFILFMFAIFPIIDFISFGVTYCACSNLNDLELREAARVPALQANATVAAVEESWRSSSMGKLAAVVSYPSVNVSYAAGPANANGEDKYISVATTFSVKPLLAIPIFAKVPGLGAEVTYTIVGRRLLENPSYAAL
jgi:hypothetical protein